jgi:hypothetical protein
VESSLSGLGSIRGRTLSGGQARRAIEQRF